MVDKFSGLRPLSSHRTVHVDVYRPSRLSPWDRPFFYFGAYRPSTLSPFGPSSSYMTVHFRTLEPFSSTLGLPNPNPEGEIGQSKVWTPNECDRN